MASEPTDGERVSRGDDLDGWLDERAGALGLDREQFVERLLAAYRAAVTGSDDVAADDAPLGGRLDRIEREHEANLEDVRKRVLQLKGTTEEKAPVDHRHEEFDELDGLEKRLSALEDEVDSLAADADRLRDSESAIDEELAVVASKLDRLARAVVEMRNAEESGSGGDDTDRLRELQRTAAREGHERADCAACGETVHVGLLPEASCPACNASLHHIEGGGLLRTATLTVEASEE
ncbi:hypothetical protein [Halorarius halobius]|uniref:hypothetical protein n=1 Tax=Halorarius halobius TaxID=2962671 RepID=UPI0020CD8E44|nr:hypothetical protein [Halorarius halobius]